MMGTLGEVKKLVREQGWSDKEFVGMVLNYIANYGDLVGFLVWLREYAVQE